MTIVVLGVNRGGTSAIAASLHALGISLGEQSYAPIYEDEALANAYRAKNWRAFKATVAKYDAKYGQWAWKLPDAMGDLKKTASLFNGAKYIVVFRDLSAIAARQQQALQHDQLTSMKKANDAYRSALTFIAKHPAACLVVSYEKLLVAPQTYAHSLLQFLQLPEDAQTVQQVCAALSVSPLEYQQWSAKAQQQKLLSNLGLAGHLDSAKAQRVFGWAINTRRQTPVSLTILIDGKPYHQCYTSRLRSDLIRAGISIDGCNGFSVPLPADIKPGAVIAVVESSSQAHLIGSPVTYSG